MAALKDIDWLAVRAFGIHIDQTHLHGSERIFEIAITGVTLIFEPFAFRPPINIFFRLPHIGTTAAETKRLQAHRFQSAIASEDHEIRP